MKQIPLIEYGLSIPEESKFEDFELTYGQIVLDEYHKPYDAVYLKDENNNVIAYIAYSPWWGSDKDVEIKSYTNPALRKKGVQKKLNAALILLLREKGVEKMVSRILLDNSRSLTNRLQMQDPGTDRVLKAETVGLDELDVETVLGISVLWIEIDVNETVESNQELINAIGRLQRKLKTTRADGFFLLGNNK